MDTRGMKFTNHEEFDIDHKINLCVDETKKTIADLKAELNPKQFNQVAKAISTTIIDSIID